MITKAPIWEQEAKGSGVLGMRVTPQYVKVPVWELANHGPQILDKPHQQYNTEFGQELGAGFLLGVRWGHN